MRRLLAGVVVLFSLGAALRAAETAADRAEATIVVYNRNTPESIALAYFYAKTRAIPYDHLVGLECSSDEEISRQEYDQNIAGPLRKVFAERTWWTLRDDEEQHPVVRSSRIHFVALIRGMPLKVRSTPAYDGDEPQKNPAGNQNAASVDSELAVLGLFSRQISGTVHNPYFQNFRPIAELTDSPLLLVCRLDGPSEPVVRQMISDAVATGKTGLWGRAYVDGADHGSGGLAEGDLWLKQIVQDLRRAGVPTVYDTNPATFPSGFPMNDCALYYGWYAGSLNGPFSDPEFKFQRGAVAVHIHSFSASTLRSPGANWVGPLLSKGAAASLGNVYEPYLQLTAHLDIFNDRLLHGFTFAESAYMSVPVVSWMNVAVGDPLYRPYGNWLQLDAARNVRRKSNWENYHEFALRKAKLGPSEYLTKGRAAASRSRNAPMLEDLGLIQKENGNLPAASSYLRQARSVYSSPDDILRTVLEQVEILRKEGDKEAALTLLRSNERSFADSPSANLLRKIEGEINPPRATPKPSP